MRYFLYVKYKILGGSVKLQQLTLFDFLEKEKPFSWDDDINELHKMIVDLFNENGMKVEHQEFTVWSHAREFGFRMDMCIEITKKFFTKEFLNKLDSICKYAKSKQISLEPCAAHIFQNEKTGCVYIYSHFLDKRKRRKEW